MLLWSYNVILITFFLNHRIFLHFLNIYLLFLFTYQTVWITIGNSGKNGVIFTFHGNVFFWVNTSCILILGWVLPICLPSGTQLNKDYVGDYTEVAGWGVYDVTTELPSDHIYYVRLPIVPLKKCIEAFKEHTTLRNSQLCVGGNAG